MSTKLKWIKKHYLWVTFWVGLISLLSLFGIAFFSNTILPPEVDAVVMMVATITGHLVAGSFGLTGMFFAAQLIAHHNKNVVFSAFAFDIAGFLVAAALLYIGVREVQFVVVTAVMMVVVVLLGAEANSISDNGSKETNIKPFQDGFSGYSFIKVYKDGATHAFMTGITRYGKGQEPEGGHKPITIIEYESSKGESNG